MSRWTREHTSDPYQWLRDHEKRLRRIEGKKAFQSSGGGDTASHTHAHSAASGKTPNDHHNEAHTVASHSDTTATGTELETLTDGSNADSLHSHTGVGTHASTHSDGGADEVTVENLATASTDVSTALRPDGAGGLAFSDVAHADLTGVGTDDHHAQAHTVASHSDTTATGAELETLTDGSNADALHTHASGTSGHTIQENSTPLTQRANLNFQDGVVATDDAGNDQTDINLDWAGVADLADVAAAEAEGTATTAPRGDHVHAHGSGYAGGHTDVAAHNVLDAAHADTFAADTPVDGDVLTWVDGNSRWEAVAPAASGFVATTKWGVD